jgi:hypothetical protein
VLRLQLLTISPFAGYTVFQTEPLWKFALELLSLWTIILLPIGDSKHSTGDVKVLSDSIDSSGSHLAPQLAMADIKPILKDEESA